MNFVWFSEIDFFPEKKFQKIDRFPQIFFCVVVNTGMAMSKNVAGRRWKLMGWE